MPRTLPLLLLLLVSTPALADDAIAPPAPAFPHLAPGGLSTELGADLAIISSTSGDSDYLVMTHLAGQVVSPINGMGAYLALATVSADDYGDFDTTLGNLDLGGLYHVAGREDVDATFRLGMVVPTMSDDGFAGLAYGIGTLVNDPSDIVTAQPGVTSLRFGASPTYHQDRVYVRADLGVDVAVAGADSDAPALVHADLGLGIAPRPFGGSVELQTLCTTDRTDADRCVHLLAADLQIPVGAHGVGVVGVSHPFGFEGLDEVFSVEVGFRVRR